MVAPAELVSRRAEALVAEALADTRVGLVNGARQAGKVHADATGCRQDAGNDHPSAG
jgi:hypothetical protein